MVRQLAEQVGIEGVPSNMVYIAIQRSGLIERIPVVIFRNGRGTQIPFHKCVLFVEQPRHRRHIPNGAAPGSAGGIAFGGTDRVVCQIVAERVFSFQPMLQFIAGGGKPVHHAEAGHLHQRHTAVKNHPGGRYILLHVKFVGVRPGVGMAAQPHHHGVFPHGRIF